MKINILSLGIRGTNENYGALLQIYAFKEFLKKEFDATVRVIDYSGKNTGVNRKRFRSVIRRYISYMSNMISGLNEGSWELGKRIIKNNIFINKNFDLTPKYDFHSLKDAKFDCDFFIAESDVIWDPSFRNAGFDDAYFLNMKCFDNGAIKIVYAASMGDIKFKERDFAEFKKKISGLDYFSVREDYSKNFILEKYNIETEVLLDPTLLLGEIDYNKFILENTENYEYVLVYFPAEENKHMIEAAEKYAQQNNLKIIYVIRKSIHYRDDKYRINVGVKEFLTLIKNANTVFCDSFHGICFSIIFRKQFWAFGRDDGRKIEDVCNRFEIANRYNNSEIDITDVIDYDKVYSILEFERKKAKEWLITAFEHGHN